MKILLTLILPIVFLACSQGQETKKHIPVPKARKLNDSAVNLAMQSSANYDKAISLLDKATQIDSNYYLAYGNKLSFQLSLNRLTDALITTKNLIRIKPQSPDSYVTTGIVYWKLGDSTLAIDHFNKASVLFDKILDTMSTSNKMYETALMNKAINLILIGHQEKGNSILNELYNAQKDEAHREIFGQFLNKTKKEILDELFNPESPVTESEPIIKN